MKEIVLNNNYRLLYSDICNWNIYRADGSVVCRNNLPGYVVALVEYIIKEE